jgi:murein DD-endopeptidase MepM/ murein hydrolase activator NlpD
MALPAQAAPASRITATSAAVSVGQVAYIDATIREQYCRVETQGAGGHAVGKAQRVPATKVRLTWTVPADAATGTARVGVRCARRATSVRRGRLLRSRISISGGRGHGLPIPVRTVKLIKLSSAASEQVALTGLPDGSGNPADYTFQPPAGTGPGPVAFATYWPLSTRTQARVTEGQGGAYSHNTQYTRNAVDLGVPAGTEIRAGFPGVIARVSSGCAVGAKSCGSGYGNYVYLKAPDGTCAIMAHLSQVNVALGQQIAQYDLIGLSGNTGNSTGAHLHYDHVDCVSNQSQSWAPIEGGQYAEGATISSQNHPDARTAPQTQPQPAMTYPEIAGGTLPTYSNPANAGGESGPTIDNQQTVPVLCKVQGFKVQDGNTNWYRLADKWSGRFYASADGFYNGAPPGGSLQGTPFVDPQVPDC